MYFRLPMFVLLAAAVLNGYFYFSTKTERSKSPPIIGPFDSIQAQPLQSIRPNELRSHLEFLADDLLAGRATGSKGARLAALYIANQFKRIGLEPIGNGISYYQHFQLFRRGMRPRFEVSLEIGGEFLTLTEQKDFLVVGTPQVTEFDLTRELVFTGFGIRAPEYQYDDFKNVDITDKVTLCLSGEPKSESEAFFEGSKVTEYAKGSAKRQIAKSLRAAGTVTIMSREALSGLDWGAPSESLIQHRLALRPEERNVSNEYFPAIVLHPDVAARLFSDTQLNLDQLTQAAALGKSESFPLKRRIHFKLLRQDPKIEEVNVMGFLEGSDPKLKSEVIVFTAHYDHMGIGTAVDGDSIYNGAADNASGVAGLLELAEAFTLLEIPPRRSLLFLAFSAEERGLLGSEFYVNNPVLSLENTLANFNLDIIGIGDSSGVVVYGMERSSLGETVRQAAEVVGLQILPDELPEENLYRRSDHYNFAESGVPAIYPSIGTGKEGLCSFSNYYHKPNDEIDLPFNYNYMQKHVQMVFLAGLQVANADDRPRWTAGDKFEKVRGDQTIH